MDSSIWSYSVLVFIHVFVCVKDWWNSFIIAIDKIDPSKIRFSASPNNRNVWNFSSLKYHLFMQTRWYPPQYYAKNVVLSYFPSSPVLDGLFGALEFKCLWIVGCWFWLKWLGAWMLDFGFFENSRTNEIILEKN